MKLLPSSEIWFVTGSQHLYGPGPLKQVADNSAKIAEALSASKRIPYKIVFKTLATTPDEILKVCEEALRIFAAGHVSAHLRVADPKKLGRITDV